MSKLALNGGPRLRTQPFHRWPHWGEAERRALEAVLDAGSWGGYPAPNRFAAAFAEQFAAAVDAAWGVCCTNGSVAIELALQAAGIGPGDEVIVPAYTFVATASSVAFCRATPVFCDVEPARYCIDPAAAEAAITERTRAIIVVHLACNMADMDAIGALAKKHDLVLIEDGAHAHGHRWNGRGAGSLGDLATFSFQTSKLLTAGEGGIVTGNDPILRDRVASLVNCGRKEPGWDGFEGQMLGKNSRITEFQAALLSAQLARLDEQTARRQERTARLEARLAGMPGIGFTERDPRNDRRAIYQFIVKYDPASFDGLPRDRFLEALRAEGVPAEGDFYVPLFRDELFAMDPRTNPIAGGDFDLEAFSAPVATRAAYEEAIWLPHELFLGSEADVDAIADAFAKVRESRAELSA